MWAPLKNHTSVFGKIRIRIIMRKDLVPRATTEKMFLATLRTPFPFYLFFSLGLCSGQALFAELRHHMHFACTQVATWSLCDKTTKVASTNTVMHRRKAGDGRGGNGTKGPSSPHPSESISMGAPPSLSWSDGKRQRSSSESESLLPGGWRGGHGDVGLESGTGTGGHSTATVPVDIL